MASSLVTNQICQIRLGYHSPCPQNAPNTKKRISDKVDLELDLRSTGNQFTFLERTSIPVIVSATTTTVRPIAFQTLNANGAKYVFHFTAVVSGLLMYARHLNEKEASKRYV